MFYNLVVLQYYIGTNRKDIDSQNQGSIWRDEVWETTVVPEYFSSVNKVQILRWLAERESSSTLAYVIKRYRWVFIGLPVGVGIVTVI